LDIRFERTYLSSVTGGGGNSTDTSLKHRHSLLQDGDGWVTHTGVDVSILLPCELAGSIGGVHEVVGTCLEKGDGSGTVDWVRLLTTVELDGLELGGSEEKGSAG
jgi:hypothetical protein